MSQKISLDEALEIINTIVDKPFKELFPDQTVFNDIILNKGKSGQLLEQILLKLKLTSDLLDFTDGELKSVEWRIKDFSPDQTMAITMVNTHIDDFLSDISFEESYLYQKIRNFILLPTIKKSKSGTANKLLPENWYFSHPYHVCADMPQYKEFYDQLKKDYYTIRSKIIKTLDNGGYLETTNGKYLQIRTKGSGKNTICFSSIYNRNINKSGAAYCFYLQLDGIKAIKNINN